MFNKHHNLSIQIHSVYIKTCRLKTQERKTSNLYTEKQNQFNPTIETESKLHLIKVINPVSSGYYSTKLLI